MGSENVMTGQILAGRLALRVSEAAAVIGVSSAFLRLEITRGNLNATRLGRRIVLMRVELEQYLASRQTVPRARGGQSVGGANTEVAGARARSQRDSKREQRPNSEADARALESGGTR